MEIEFENSLNSIVVGLAKRNNFGVLSFEASILNSK
jgi:hypothetical protein